MQTETTTTREQDLNRMGKCKVCHEYFNAGGHWDRERLTSLGICPTCDGWMEFVQHHNEASSIRINGEHYTIDKTNYSHFKGTIRRTDGTFQRVSLWHNGTIPTAFRNMLDDNAKFAKRIEVAYIG